jgi:chemotaxis protein methyltransferase CheR
MAEATTVSVFAPRDFEQVCAFVRAETGIELGEDKQVLVYSRLSPRLRERGLRDCREYLRLVEAPGEAIERARAIHALTTHETYFFREEAQFQALSEYLRQQPFIARRLRAWSAACSTGEEAWTLGMTLAESLHGREWEAVGTDVSPPAVEVSARGFYPIKAAKLIPQPLLRRFFMRGTGEHDGQMRVSDELWRRTRFEVANLCQPQSALGQFDVVLLRNVLIYFRPETKLRVLRNVLAQLRPGGLLITGLSEGLAGLELPLEPLGPSIHRKPGGG